MLSIRPFKVLFLFNQIRKVSDRVIVSKAKPLEIPEITLHEFIWNNLSKWSDRAAITCFETGKSFTYAEIHKKSLSLAHYLQNIVKIKRKRTVGIYLPNVPEYPVIVLGIIQAGLRVTLINALYTNDEIKRQLTNSKAGLVFTLSELVPIVRLAIKIPIVAINGRPEGTKSFEEIMAIPGENNFRTTKPNDIAVLPYSSGTTGLPKGVELSHKNIVANLLQMTSPEFCVIHTDYQWNVPAFLPFSHNYGFVIILLASLIQGSHLIAMPKFSPNHLIKVMQKYKIDLLFGVPPIIDLLVNHPSITSEDIRKIRLITSGAAPLSPLLIHKLKEKSFNEKIFLEGFGMTETSAASVIQTFTLENAVKVGGSGYLLPNMEAKVIPIDGSSLENLPPNQPGELILKGPQITKGYHNNRQATREVFVDGWLKTGDVAYYDEHEHFFISGRLKEIIKVKGFSVAPAEIEEVLRQHPCVNDCAVVGIADEVSGEAPKAFVVTKKPVLKQDLMEFVAGKVAKHKKLKQIVFVKMIPKAPTGQILRRILKEM